MHCRMRASTLYRAGLHAGIKHTVESMDRMQQVHEMARIVRERYGKPLKMPERFLTAVTAGVSFWPTSRASSSTSSGKRVRFAASHGLAHMSQQDTA